MTYKQKYELLINKKKRNMKRILEMSNYFYVLAILFIFLGISLFPYFMFEAGMFYGSGCLTAGFVFGSKIKAKRWLKDNS